MKYLAMIALAALAVGMLCYQLFFLVFALRSLFWAVVALALIYVVIKEVK